MTSFNLNYFYRGPISKYTEVSTLSYEFEVGITDILSITYSKLFLLFYVTKIWVDFLCSIRKLTETLVPEMGCCCKKSLKPVIVTLLRPVGRQKFEGA